MGLSNQAGPAPTHGTDGQGLSTKAGPAPSGEGGQGLSVTSTAGTGSGRSGGGTGLSVPSSAKAGGGKAGGGKGK